MKQFRWYLAFLTLVFVGDRLGGYWAAHQVATSQFRYSRLYLSAEQADIVLLGNSRGLTFFQPYLEEITGKSTLNLSYNGLPIDIAQCLCLDFLEAQKKRSPESNPHLIIDITLCDRENDALLAAFLPYAAHSPRLDALIRQKTPKIWWGGRVSSLFRYNNEIFQRALYYRNHSDEDWLLDRQISPALAQEVSKHSYHLDVQPSLIQQLKETVSAAKAVQSKVTLVIGPYFPGFQVKNLDALQQAVEKATGLPVLDYRNALTDPSDFGDFMHPNKKGSVRYLDLLKKEIIP